MYPCPLHLRAVEARGLVEVLSPKDNTLPLSRGSQTPVKSIDTGMRVKQKRTVNQKEQSDVLGKLRKVRSCFAQHKGMTGFTSMWEWFCIHLMRIYI